MKKKLSEKKQYMAYILSTDPEFEYSQKKISDLMDVSQPTVSNAIKEVKHLRTVYNLEKQLAEAKEKIQEKYQVETKPKGLIELKRIDDENWG